MRGLVLAVAVLAGCYKPSAEDCSYRCADGVCPVGLTCENNQLCREPGNLGMPCGAATDDSGNTCSSNIMTDPNNCGLCGRSCKGQQCAEGRCAVEPVRNGLYEPGVLAAGFGYVLYSEGRYGDCAAASSRFTLLRSMDSDNYVYMVPVTDGNCPGNALLASTNAYVTGLGYVKRYTFTTNIPAGNLATSAWASGVDVSTTAVYYGTHNPTTSVYSVLPDLSGTSNVVKMVTRKVQDVVRMQNQIWFETSVDGEPIRHIDAVNPDGTNHQPMVLMTNGQASLAYTATPSPGYLFVGEEGTPGRLLQIIDGVNGSSEVTSGDGIIDVAADEIAVYWAEHTGSGDAAIYMRRHGSQMIEPVALEQPLIREIALDPPYLYFITQVDSPFPGELFRVVVR